MAKIKNKVLAEIIDLLKLVVITFAVVFSISTFVLRPVQVDGTSMFPLLHDNDVGFANILNRTINGIKRFDIVVIYIPERNEYLVKRVIGLPGETVEYRNDVLYINGQPVAEDFFIDSYIQEYKTNNPGKFFTDNFGPVVVGEDEYFVMGDNRPGSADSRYYGAYKGSQLIASGIIILWPVDHMLIR
ncbi:MAG: signal peptidase I [Erysipelotrichaceae bacterium]|jgi:signal peptidase I|nr:signal peptidase I [Erysipelotrichaceae bacterium]